MSGMSDRRHRLSLFNPDFNQRFDMELEASEVEVETSRFRPEGAAPNQPGATPWDEEVKLSSSPARAAQRRCVAPSGLPYQYPIKTQGVAPG
jgi:hypothetical protein